MKVRTIKTKKPYPRAYSLGASVQVPPYTGPWDMLMDTVRVAVKSSSQTNPDHKRCVAKIMEARQQYIDGLGVSA